MVKCVLSLVVLLLPTLAGAFVCTGPVSSVTDGDTFKVQCPCGLLDVRMYGVDAPERAQRSGLASREALKALVLGQTVTLTTTGGVTYGRLVARVTLPDGSDLSQVLVGQGVAWHYVKYAKKDVTLMFLEQQARAARVGLWGDGVEPIPPWVWRAQHKKKGSK